MILTDMSPLERVDVLLGTFKDPAQTL